MIIITKPLVLTDSLVQLLMHLTMNKKITGLNPGEVETFQFKDKICLTGLWSSAKLLRLGMCHRN